MIRGMMMVVVLAALSAGCAVGQTITYHDATPSLRPPAPPIPLAIAVQDQRPEVLSGKKPQTFVGLMRGGYGNPFDVNTTSKKALADDVMAVLWRSFRVRGYQLFGVAVTPTVLPAQIVAKAASTGAARLLVVQLGYWKSDTYVSTTLKYDVTARVLEVPSGRELGAWRVARDRVLGSDAWNPPALAKRAVPEAYNEALEELLNAQPVIGALVAVPPPPPVAAPAPAEPPAGLVPAALPAPGPAATPAEPPASNLAAPPPAVDAPARPASAAPAKASTELH
jgi:hypothetical protein